MMKKTSRTNSKKTFSYLKNKRRSATKQLLLMDVLLYILRNDFYSFCCYYAPEFFTPKKKYLKTVCDAFQKVTEGKVKKLAISLPPRSGKSFTTTLWCAWMIGRAQDDPDLSIMRNSYGNNLAEKFSYDVRDIIQSQKFLQVFPAVKLKPDHKRIDDWAITTSKQSTYFCAGVGGAITGKGCKTAAILDDGIKNIEEALSKTILEKTWQWVTSTHYSRMESGCSIIHIGTRWSKKDPIGKAIEEDNGIGWTQVVVPALTQSGESFCDEIKTTDEFLYLKKITPDFIWQAEFMQNPVDIATLLFAAEEMKRFDVEEIADYLEGKKQFDAIYGYTDTADEGKDYLASGTIGVIGNKCYLLDVVYSQEPFEYTLPIIASMIIKTGQTLHVVESNFGGKLAAQRIRELVEEQYKNVYIKWKPNTKNKETRILMMSGLIKEYFYFRNDVNPGSMYSQFINEIFSYSKVGENEHDDATDCITGLAELIFGAKKISLL